MSVLESRPEITQYHNPPVGTPVTVEETAVTPEMLKTTRAQAALEDPELGVQKVKVRGGIWVVHSQRDYEETGFNSLYRTTIVDIQRGGERLVSCVDYKIRPRGGVVIRKFHDKVSEKGPYSKDLRSYRFYSTLSIFSSKSYGLEANVVKEETDLGTMPVLTFVEIYLPPPKLNIPSDYSPIILSLGR